MATPCLRILGTRGVPAAHGGFETFAEYLSLFLVERGWRVIVYCQDNGTGPLTEDEWQGVERVHIPVPHNGPKGTIVFDWKAILHAARHRDLCLTLGYNTAVFCSLLRIKGIPNAINMDGIEWSRAKWGRVAKAWFWLNDWAGCWLGNYLIADHPCIQSHLETRTSSAKISMIPYGADRIGAADESVVIALGITPKNYISVIARPEPENSLLEIVKGFSARPRGVDLVILGNYQEANSYHAAVMKAASSEVKFVGAIYDKTIVQALRFFSVAYVHGHQVGGTNPSLVEALGAGNPIIAHDNRFNRWVAGDGALYFTDADSISSLIEHLLGHGDALRELRVASIERFEANFTWNKILEQYETLLRRALPSFLRQFNKD